MRIHKVLAVGAASLSLAGAAALPAIAGASNHQRPAAASKTHVFPSTLTPHTVHPGTAMTMKGHGAKKSTQYSCVFTVLKGSKYWVGPITAVNSNKHGKVTCHRTFEPYTAKSITGSSSTHKCPLTKKDKKHHYRCALSISTLDKSSAANQYFTAKKH
jgi:hypothetical protein